MDDASDFFKALGDPLRLRILRLLPTADRCVDVYNVSELAQELGVSQPTVSHHLKILRQARVVRCRKMCRDVYYWIDAPALRRALADLRSDLLPPRKPRTPATRR